MDEDPERQKSRGVHISARPGVGKTSAAIDLINKLKDSGASSSFLILDSFDKLSQADPANVQEIAASQIQLLTGYYNAALKQSARAFSFALLFSAVGLALFVGAIVFSLWTGSILATGVSGFAGTVVELISGLAFYLYSKTSSQFADFLIRLDTLQRYLLANSLCERLSDSERDKSRATLIQEISKPHPARPA